MVSVHRIEHLRHEWISLNGSDGSNGIYHPMDGLTFTPFGFRRGPVVGWPDFRLSLFPYQIERIDAGSGDVLKLRNSRSCSIPRAACSLGEILSPGVY